MSLTPPEIRQYSPQLTLPEIGESGQMRLKNARVLCVGAGGLGSSLLFYLAAAGVGQIDILDDDVVSNSNLQRQILYQHRQIGQKKAYVAKQRLMALNPHIKVNAWEAILELKTAREWISQCDIVADCSDNFATRYLVNDTCAYLKKPFVFASILKFKGACSLFLGGQSPCFRCLFPHVSGWIPDCREGGVLGVLPGLLGIMQANEVIKFLLQRQDTLLGYLLTVDMLTMQFNKIKLSKNPDCPLCSNAGAHSFPKTEKECLYSNVNIISKKAFKETYQYDKTCLLLDVRSRAEHEMKNIGGLLIPLPELPKRLAELDAQKTIIVYCQTGLRSAEAAHLLIRKQFTSVGYLEAGIANWEE